MGISRQELFSRLQLIRLMEPLTENAMMDYENRIWRRDPGMDTGESPHGAPWHTSFHASSFPGDNEKACPRKAMYGLMDIPQDKAFSPRSRVMMEMGKLFEDILVSRYHAYGILLSPPPWEPIQLGFIDPETRLTGNCDAVIMHPRLGRPHVVEVKMKYQRDIDRMRVGLQGPDDSHVVQLKTYVAFLHLVSKELWPDLPALKDGTIYYASRDNPRSTAEFFVDYDPKFREAGREVLRQWRHYFYEGTLPTEPPQLKADGKSYKIQRHPLNWHWTKMPCMWCDYQNICKLDHQHGVELLEDSYAIGYAKEIREEYDYKATRKVVLDRWADFDDEAGKVLSTMVKKEVG